MRLGRCAVVLLVFMLKSVNLKAAEPAPAAITFPPSNAQRFVLPNGLTLLVKEDHSAPVASVQAWCATGSITEDKHLGAGLSHILEHMLFKGTKTRSTSEIAQKIQDVGGYINAYTSFDRTVFWIDVPKDGVVPALDILADAMMNSTLPPAEYTKEQDVIRREFAMGMDDPDRMMAQELFATAYQEHPYRLPVIGLADIYNQLTQQQVMEYYKARYVPNNLTFIVVGDVDAEKVRTELETLFKGIPAQSIAPVYIPPEPTQLGRRESQTEFPTELTHFAMAWHVPEITHPDVPALDLLSVILGEGRSSRLYRKLREEAGLVFSVSAFSYTPGQPGLIGIDATMEPKNRAAVETAIEQMIAEVKQNGVIAAELEKAKKIVLSHELGSLTTMRGQASDLGTNWLLTRNLDFSRDNLAKLAKVTAEQIRNVAARYLTEDNLTVVSLNPKGSLKDVNATTAVATAGEVKKFELPNGLRLLVREDPRLPLVAMSAVFRSGLLAETAATNGITRLTAKCLIKGTTTRTAEQISSALESVGGGISSDAGNNSMSVKVGVTQPDLALGLDILADVIQNATMPEKAVAREKEIQLAHIKEEEEEPTNVARRIARAAIFGEHPLGLRGEGSAASVSKLTPKDLLAFRDRYLVAQNCVLSIFGNVKAAEVQRMVEQRFGGMKPGEIALAKVPPPPVLRENKSVEANRDKAQAIILVGYRGASIYDPDRYALELIEEASSDLGSRFLVRIREQMGLAYFVGAAQMQSLVPGIFGFYLGTDPAKVDQVRAALLDEIKKLSTQGLTQVELDRAKKKLIGQQQIANQSNDTFGYMCALDELYGLGFDEYKRLPQQVQSVSVDDIKRVAAKYFTQPYVVATVKPVEQPKPPKNK